MFFTTHDAGVRRLSGLRGKRKRGKRKTRETKNAGNENQQGSGRIAQTASRHLQGMNLLGARVGRLVAYVEKGCCEVACMRRERIVIVIIRARARAEVDAVLAGDAKPLGE